MTAIILFFAGCICACIMMVFVYNVGNDIRCVEDCLPPLDTRVYVDSMYAGSRLECVLIIDNTGKQLQWQCVAGSRLGCTYSLTKRDLWTLIK